MKVMITGASGLLGPYLCEAFQGHTVFGISREDCDLRSRSMVRGLMAHYQPEVIIHAAAETDIDFCERDPLAALDINRDAVGNLVGTMEPTAKFVMISTDMVYPDIRGPHLEPDVGPVNMYGRSKLAGEHLASINPRHLICRTNFFGASRTEGRQSFSDWVIESLRDEATDIFFNDIMFSPLHMKTLSETLCGLVDDDLRGTYNLGATTSMSKAAFAGAVAEHVGLLPEFNRAAIGPSSYRTHRPHDLSMDVDKITNLGYPMPTLEEEIKLL